MSTSTPTQLPFRLPGGEPEIVIEWVDTEPETSPDGRVLLNNPHISRADDDLYHFGFKARDEMISAFSDVRFVIMGGTETRMHNFARMIARELQLEEPLKPTQIVNLSRNPDRYALFKVGPVLTASHGMGQPSIAIAVKELIKLVHYAECRHVTFIRVGTSGGIGLAPGSVVITSQAINGFTRPHYDVISRGIVKRYSTILDEELARELKALADADRTAQHETRVGLTVCANDFYEGQSRLDDVQVTYSLEDKLNYLESIRRAGVLNFEMEGTAFAAICRMAAIPAAIVCGTMLDRMHGDKIDASHELLEEYQRRPLALVLKLIKKRLGHSQQQQQPPCHTTTNGTLINNEAILVNGYGRQ